jgi:uncharacterized repeat protein (TIGR01451 family)
MPQSSRCRRLTSKRYRRLFFERCEERYLLAATIPVNSSLDTNERDAVLTLREAILVSNRALPIETLSAEEQLRIIGEPTDFDTDTIEFAIAGSGVHTIALTAALPTISDPVIIDGYTQLGAARNNLPLSLGTNARLQIELDGSMAGDVHGITLGPGSDGSRISGLVINRFGINGIQVDSSGNTIDGNFVGTNANGAIDLGGINVGIFTNNSANNTIGGTTPGSRNLISGNEFDGIRLVGGGENLVQGNLIGTDATGKVDLGNTDHGIFIGDSAGNTIGGSIPGAGNVISGNGESGIGIFSSLATGNLIQGNLIGTDATGQAAVGNAVAGIEIVNAALNVVGGTVAGARNVISGNVQSGVRIAGVTATQNVIQGNYVGTRATGTGSLGNGTRGIEVLEGRNNIVGGSTGIAGNVIAFNTDEGISIEAGEGNRIQSNSIYSNGRLGIDLFSESDDANGITPNDTLDLDAGSNRLQNSPAITSVLVAEVPVLNGNLQIGIRRTLEVKGILASSVGGTFQVELFANDAADPSGVGEGQRYLGYAEVVDLDLDGTEDFTFTAVEVLPVGSVGQIDGNDLFTATATATQSGNTSEFSAAATAIANAPLITISDAPTVVEGDTGTVDVVFTVNISQAPTQPITVDYTTADDSAKGLVVTRIASNLARPVFATAPPSDMNRLFVMEQHTGSLRILDRTTSPPTLLPTPFLTIPSGVSTGNEQGLLGLAFHPNYSANGLFYVNYTDLFGNTQIRQFARSAIDPDLADPASGVAVLSFSQPQSNHNGGWLGFGPDGYLYIASGDGGGSNDSGFGHTDGIGNSQDIENLLGKMLRIDVNGDDFPSDVARNYAIPPTNPFAGAIAGADEIWSYGLRNPWRPAFDRLTGDLWIADVGQNAREEINFQPATSIGGENYGWRLREGTIATPSGGVGGDKPAGAIDPIYDYLRGIDATQFRGFAVTGGYVYRGPIPELNGQYFFGDNVSEGIWSLRFSGSNPSEFNGTQFNDRTNWTSLFNPDTGPRVINSIASFGEDPAGNLFIVDLTGEIYQVTNGADYDQKIGQITFTPGGPLTQTITVRVIGDTLIEPTETFFVNLGNVQGAAIIDDGQGMGTILDDDTVQSADLELTQIVSTPTANFGEQVTFTVTVTNKGSDAILDAEITNLIPAGLSNVEVTPSPGTTYNSQTGIWFVGPLLTTPGQDSVTLTIAGTVAVSNTTISNTAEITASSTFDPDSTPNNHNPDEDDQSSASITIPAAADLTITKTDSSDPVLAGNNLTYTITVSNAGTQEAATVELRDAIPAGTTFVSAVQASGPEFSLTTPSVGATGLFTATIGTFALGATATFQLVVNVNRADILVNTARVTTTTLELDSTNNTDTETTAVIAQADLSLTKTVSNLTPNVGEQVTFTVTLTNNGPNQTTGIQVTDVLPSGLSNVAVTASNGTGTYNMQTGVWSLGVLPPLPNTHKATLTITATIAASSPITNTAEVTASSTLDPDSTPNNHIPQEDDQASITVTPKRIDLSLTKSVDNHTPDVDQNVTFTIIVTNAGPSSASGVQVKDLLPAGLSFQSFNTAHGSYNNTTGIWTIGAVGAQASATLQITAKATTTGTSVNTAEIIAAAEFDIDSTPNNQVATEDDQSSVSVTAQTTLGIPYLVLGAEAASKGKPTVAIYDMAGNRLAKFYAYETTYRGGVRVALADVTGDGIPEIVTAPGRGRAPQIKIFSLADILSGGTAPQPIYSFLAYAANFTGGVNVAVGDVLGDGLADIVVTPSREGKAVKGLKNGGTEVRVFSNNFRNNPAVPFGGAPLSFLAFPPKSVGNVKFIGGASVAVGDINGDATAGGKHEIIVGSGSGLRATVRAFNVAAGSPIIVGSWLPFSKTVRGGVFVAAGRINDDLAADIVVSAAQGGSSVVEIYSGNGSNQLRTPLKPFAGPQKTIGGQSAVHVIAKSRAPGGIVDQILVAQGSDGRTKKVLSIAPPLSGSAVDFVFENDPDFGGGFNLG